MARARVGRSHSLRKKRLHFARSGPRGIRQPSEDDRRSDRRRCARSQRVAELVLGAYAESLGGPQHHARYGYSLGDGGRRYRDVGRARYRALFLGTRPLPVRDLCTRLYGGGDLRSHKCGEVLGRKAEGFTHGPDGYDHAADVGTTNVVLIFRSETRLRNEAQDDFRVEALDERGV